MLSLLVSLIVAGLITYLLYWLVGQLPLPQPVKLVCTVLIGLFLVVYLIDLLLSIAPAAGHPLLR